MKKLILPKYKYSLFSHPKVAEMASRFILMQLRRAWTAWKVYRTCASVHFQPEQPPASRPSLLKLAKHQGHFTNGERAP